MGTGSFLGVKCGRGLLLISHPPSSAEVLEEFSYTSTPLWAVRPVQSLSRAITLLPLWTVRPVQSLSRAITLLPLWAVRPVQSLSACTRVTFTFLIFTVYVLLNTVLGVTFSNHLSLRS